MLTFIAATAIAFATGLFIVLALVCFVRADEAQGSEP